MIQVWTTGDVVKPLYPLVASILGAAGVQEEDEQPVKPNDDYEDELTHSTEDWPKANRSRSQHTKYPAQNKHDSQQEGHRDGLDHPFGLGHLPIEFVLVAVHRHQDNDEHNQIEGIDNAKWK